MKNVKFAVIIFLLLLSSDLNSQTNDVNDIQYGVALKTTLDLNLQHPNFNIAVTGGVGGHPFDFSEAYPSLHAGFLLYNRGDLISSYKKSFFRSMSLDIFVNVSLSLGFYMPNTNFNKRFVSLYHFSDFTPNPLQNPFQHSLTIGTNFIWLLLDDYKQEIPQRIGFTGVMIDRRVQINTYNDGSIWGRSKLADGLDRYYTGGGLIVYHINNNHDINTVEFSFHKFTGHEKYAFDIANELQIDFIPFKNPETYYYSKNRFRLSLTNINHNFGVHLTAHNVDRDPQDWIHFKGGETYHPDIFSDQSGLSNELKRMGIGGFWNPSYLKFTN